MKRRELIKLVTLATGAVISIPLSSSLLTACKRATKKEDLDYTLQFFSGEDFDLIKTLVDIILPKTDSPAASEVGVHQIIDTIIGTVYNPSQRQNFEKKFLILKQYLTSGINLDLIKNLSKSQIENDQEAKSAFLDIKQQTVAYYLSTKEIATNYLNYLPIPGEYKSCISLDEVNGKAWAL